MSTKEKILIKALEDALIVLRYDEGYMPYNPIVSTGRKALAFAKKVDICEVDKLLSDRNDIIELQRKQEEGDDLEMEQLPE